MELSLPYPSIRSSPLRNLRPPSNSLRAPPAAEIARAKTILDIVKPIRVDVHKDVKTPDSQRRRRLTLLVIANQKMSNARNSTP